MSFEARRSSQPAAFVLPLDALAWAMAIPLATFLRYELSLPPFWLRGVVLMVLAAAAAQAALGVRHGLYTGRWRTGSFDEMSGLGLVVGSTTVCIVAVDVLGPRLVPLSAALGAGAFALLIQSSFRYAMRWVHERRLRPSADHATRVVVFGAGSAGNELVQAMLRTPTSPYLPVALLDDDLRKSRLRICGIPVRGTRRHLADVVAAEDARAVVIAIPGAPATLVRDVVIRARAAGVTVKLLPSLTEMLTDTVSVTDVRPVTRADLLGRRETEIDIETIAGYLTGHRVLITGAGGSIGSELCRQVHRFAPAQLIMLDRDESALHAVQLSLEGHALLDSRALVVADIRDPDRLAAIFAEHRPQVVFHTAALKHLPLLQMHPSEAVKTNVLGTLNVLQAAMNAGVERFVNVSTDKAADPVSVLGYSKRIAERLTAWSAGRHSGVPLSVRFGNVLGSRGSVLTTFQEQIRHGGPVTVTHPDVTRYFMTVEEAVRLVIQSGAIGRPGEVLVLDMGRPVRIADLARQLISASPAPVELRFTGLRPGEKLHEALLGDGEQDVRPIHSLISQVPVPPLDPADRRLVELVRSVLPEDELVTRMRDLAHAVDDEPSLLLEPEMTTIRIERRTMPGRRADDGTVRA
jgi:FlaA1/EpsC-like NDP-sugar epimerase